MQFINQRPTNQPDNENDMFVNDENINIMFHFNEKKKKFS